MSARRAFLPLTTFFFLCSRRGLLRLLAIYQKWTRPIRRMMAMAQLERVPAGR